MQAALYIYILSYLLLAACGYSLLRRCRPLRLSYAVRPFNVYKQVETENDNAVFGASYAFITVATATNWYRGEKWGENDQKIIKPWIIKDQFAGPILLNMLHTVQWSTGQRWIIIPQVSCEQIIINLCKSPLAACWRKKVRWARYDENWRVSSQRTLWPYFFCRKTVTECKVPTPGINRLYAGYWPHWRVKGVMGCDGVQYAYNPTSL